MNGLVVLLDAVELIAGGLGAFFLLRGWKRVIPYEIKLSLAVILLLKTYHGFSNVMQWGGISLDLDEWEDYVEIVLPMLWAVLVALFTVYRSENDAREGERRLRFIYDNISDMILAFEYSREGGAGKVVEANAAFMNKTGYSRESLDTIPVSSLLPDEKAAELNPAIMKELEEGGNVTFESGLLTARGDRVEVEGNSHLLEIQGKLVNLSTMRDLTERRRTEKVLMRAKTDLERRNEELVKLDRMKDALISDISHELKTPVAKHAMHIEILRNVLGKHDVIAKVEDVIAVIEEGIRRQQSVIGNILMMSRLETGGREYRLTKVGLEPLLRKVADEHVHAIAAFGIRLEMETRDDRVTTDEEMVWHVFSNVLGNAIKYRARQDPAIRVTSEIDGDFAIVHVIDNGVGLTTEEMERAFERFYQASSSVEGIGLGLNISRMILGKIGGRIAIRSEGRGKGTTVSVSLPLAR